MLDQEMKAQLTSVFEKLENPVTLELAPSSHSDQTDLKSLLSDLADTSSHITLNHDTIANPYGNSAPYFEVHTKDSKRIAFAGIPTGHEFTSLILAILNSDLKGKLPDTKTIARIKALKGSIKLRTYISLTCENCPEVVQSLNLISIFNPNVTHEMADGMYFQDELNQLGIMGVPTVVSGNTILHSGRANLMQVLEKLEAHFGSDEEASSTSSEPQSLGQFDVVVIGAGPAGASSAIYTVRKGLKTAVIAERIGGQVADTKGIENLISVTYTEGPQLTASLFKHMEHYPIQIFDQQRVQKIESQEPSGKRLVLESGDYIDTKSVIIATGAKWRELNVAGEKEYMGRGVAYCPHCDGPFYKGKTVAVVGGGNSGVEAAIDLSGIVGDVILIEYGAQLKADQVLVDKLKALPNVKIVTSAQTQEIVGDGKKVVSLKYKNRETDEAQSLTIDGVFIQIGLVPNSQFVKDVLNLSKYGEIEIDTKCRTSVPGIYAAGDVTTVPFKQIIISMGEGAKAGLTAFEDLVLHS